LAMAVFALAKIAQFLEAASCIDCADFSSSR
jgi:hypothetical protein